MAFIKTFGLLFFLGLLTVCPNTGLVSGARARFGSRRTPLSSKFRPVKFNEGFTVLWGPQHEQVSNDQSQITLWLDRNSGSGFKSIHSFRFGYFSVAMKLQAGYTAGVNTAFYLSNNQAHPDSHDEIDMEFLGDIPGRPYTLQTNIYVRSRNGGSERVITGREQQIHLWFDPTTSFHRYSILWTPSKIEFYVDEVPIRRYHRRRKNPFPVRPMWVYGSIWDASSWATDNGRYKVDYRYQPFVAHYSNFVLGRCPRARHSLCS